MNDWPVKARALVLKSSTDAEQKVIRQIISSNKFLRVLDLRGCFLQEIPSCVFQLTQLKYLDVSGLPITKFLLGRNDF